ncbi:MAG TPA: DUF5050 domain-containing protein, partial [Polyangiaceae bacterium]|nr:DUF5050 domain-containing protein [Polyangiaceae bacterium]
MNRCLAASRRSTQLALVLGLTLFGACGGLNDDVSLGAHSQPRDRQDTPESPRYVSRPSGFPGSPVFVPKPHEGDCDEPDAGSPTPDGCPSGSGEPWIVSQLGLYEMALDETYVYWSRHEPYQHEIWRAHRVSGHKERILVMARNVYSFAVDATHLYFTHTSGSLENTGSIRRMPKGGGTVEVLVSDLSNPTRLTLDATHVYYNLASQEGQLYRVAKSGAEPELLLSDIANPWDFRTDATYIYLAEMNAGRIVRLPKAGGAPTTLFDAYATDDIALLGDFVYFTECPAVSCNRGAHRLMRVP